MTWYKIFMFLLLGPLGFSVAYARDLSVDGAITLALKNNPELQIARLEVERAESQLRWGGRWADPELELSYRDDRFGEDEGESSFEVAFTQRFPITSKLRKEKALRRSQLILAEAEIAEQQRQLARAVEYAIINLELTRQQIETEQALQAVNEELVEFLRGQVDRGEGSIMDVNQAVLTGAELRQQMLQHKYSERKQHAGLTLLMGMPGLSFEHPFERPEHLVSAPAFSEELLENRPDYLLALAEIDAASVALGLEKARQWSEVSVSLFVEQEESVDEPGGLEENTIGGIGFSIPLPLFRGNRAAVSSVEVDKQASELKRDALILAIQNEYENAVSNREGQYELTKEMSETVLMLAEENFEMLRSAFQSGQASLIQLQQAQEQLLELKMRALESCAAHCLAEADFRFVRGEYPGVDFKKNLNIKK